MILCLIQKAQISLKIEFSALRHLGCWGTVSLFCGVQIRSRKDTPACLTGMTNLLASQRAAMKNVLRLMKSAPKLSLIPASSIFRASCFEERSDKVLCNLERWH